VSARSHTSTATTGVVAAAVLSSLLFAGCALLDLLPWLRGPAPYPPEWQWAYRSPLLWPTAGAALALALGPLLLAASGAAPLVRRPHAAARALVAAAVVLGAVLPLALLAREPAGALRTLLARTVSFSSTSYHTVAISEDARDPRRFVRRHAELLPRLAVTAKHAATHPPGPVLLFRAAVAACERSPALTEALLGAAGVRGGDFAPPLTRPARAGALLGALTLGLLAALTAWPLAELARQLGFSPLAAGRLALLWALLPGPSLIAPRLDAAIALPVVGFTALLAATGRRRGPVVLVATGIGAGTCAGAALWLSYGAAVFLAIAAAAVLAAAAAAGPSDAARWRRLAGLTVAVAVALFLAFGVPALLGGAPLRAMRAALAIHREAFTVPRRYALWLLFDPVDFAALVGVSLAVLAAWRVVTDGAAALRGRAVSAADRCGLAFASGLAALVLSGTTRGEVGRIWIPLMPFALLLALRPGDAERPALTSLIGSLVALSTATVAAAWNL